MKNKIIELRKSGHSISQISTLLSCAKSTVSYHCSKMIDHNEIIKDLNQKRQKQRQIQKKPTYDLNKQESKNESYSSFYNKTKRNLIRTIIDEITKKTCAVCGYNSGIPIALHHIDPKTKSFKLSGSNVCKVNIDLILIELKKCINLCPNCHTEVHNQILIMEFKPIEFDSMLIKTQYESKLDMALSQKPTTLLGSKRIKTKNGS